MFKGFTMNMLGMAAINTLAAAALTLGIPATVESAAARQENTQPASPIVHYRSAEVNGLNIFYREAGPKDAPTVLLLHGFPSSSFQYRNLIPVLAARYHVIAPDYPGFGRSSAPDHTAFAYTFTHLTDVVDAFLDQIDVKSYTLYIQDYGAPVGLRLALRHPERVTGLIVQNGNAYKDGIQDFWKPVEDLWADPTAANRNVLRKVLTPELTKWQYLNGVKDPTRVDPDTWMHDQTLLDRPGNDQIQLDLFYDYRTNVALYPEFQAFFRARKPPTLIVWGANDAIFPAAGAKAYLRDNPQAELHLIDSGHFALEDKADEIVPLIQDFLGRTLPNR
ncbi:Pimeloyl-ACP methyl ester carboxylesterase [Methylobacterium sp. 190mf]|uniref:alpha/beta fold hydrolase n=1 Tax=Methylobacterium sp. 190mf TaxID=1761798 RepID=UPI00089EB80F|nr:alpha/beta hydrolase [Methylobacterium sp. 190mf]SEG66744.1 Pimeloyl-ACP methyl ester carboxylesterase [Methylobacterium sp. 190mf]